MMVAAENMAGMKEVHDHLSLDLPGIADDTKAAS
jgi:hypothetical protein